MNTLLLDQTLWDLILDANGNIAMAGVPYAYAQDVASALRLFRGELWYNTAKGVPYFQKVLGKSPPLSLLKQYFVQAALSVPGVVSATCLIRSFSARTIVGTVTFTDINGGTTSVNL